MSANALGLNASPNAAWLNGQTSIGGESYVLVYDVTGGYWRSFDGSTLGGKRLAWYGDIPATSAQAPNTFEAGPASGAPALPSYRALVWADLPAGVASLASPALTGAPTAPTPAAGDSSTKLATTAFLSSNYLPLAGGTLTGGITITSGGLEITLNPPSVQNRVIAYETSGSVRWKLIANNAAETGANVGSDWSIDRYSDGGAYLDSPIRVTRSSGMVTIADGLTVNAGAATMPHLVGNSSTPAVALGAAAGSGASATITGTDLGFRLAITTGSGPGTGTLATITFAGAFAAAPHVVRSPCDAATAGLTAAYAQASTTAITLGSATAPAASTTYTWEIITLG